MSNELTTDEIDQALASVDAAYATADVARDQAMKLYGHIEWLTEQLADRDERIEQYQLECAAYEERIEALESGD